MMQDELILIDKLEDQLIDHPDASTQRDIRDTSLDETFQKKLNARAEQIRSNTDPKTRKDGSKGGPGAGDGLNLNYQFLINKSHLNYKYSDFQSLELELSEWFTFNDLTVIGSLNGLKLIYDVHSKLHTDLVEDMVEILEQNNKITDSSIKQHLQVLLYYAFGQFAERSSREDQLEQINDNCINLVVLKAYIPICNMIIAYIEEILLGAPPANKSTDANYFMCLTLVYFVVNVSLHHDDDGFRQYLREADLLSSIVKLIEHFKWKPDPGFKVRYLILLTWKLIMFEMGGTAQLAKCDDFLTDLHGIKNKNGRDLPESKLICSPLDYFAFREDIMDKYPLFQEPELKSFDLGELKLTLDDSSTNTESIEEKHNYFMAMNSFSNSLTNLMESARTYKSHTVLSQLPAPTVHIATPVPSPNLTASDYMTGGEKIRRSYQVNQAMPFIYPTEANVDGKVPFAIEEADLILRDSIYESYSTKRLWNERQKFMKQERGFVDEYSEEDTCEFDYNEELISKYPQHEREIRSVLRVEQFYHSNLVRLHSFIQILVDSIKLSRLDYNLNYAEWELNPETSYFNSGNAEAKEKVRFVLMLQLEVVNIKEVTIKASTGIILLLLKWFKTNHVLKYYYLSSLLFDQQFFSIGLDYLSRSFNNTNLQSMNQKREDEVSEYEVLTNQNQLMNPQVALPEFEFFNNCMNEFPNNYKYELINKEFIQQLPKVIDENNINNTYITHFNSNFSFILSNILKIINKILIKNVTQRIFTINELKPSELYKIILVNYDNEAFTVPILKSLKKLIPYQGRKWKSINMDLISQIYLNLKLSLKDNWLSGKDLESDLNNSYDQEIALRALLQFYNVRKYPNEMELIGYHINKNLDIPVLLLNEE